MKKVILYIAMSLDGYIADKHGGVGWLSGDGSDPDAPGSYTGFLKSVDTIIMGYKTYQQLMSELSPGVWVYPGKKTYVITHRQLESNDEIIFTDEDLSGLIADLRWKNGKNIWVCGGAEIVNQLLEQSLIDRICLTMIPTLLGDGLPLFSKHSKETRWQLVSTQSYNGMTDLVYDLKS